VIAALFVSLAAAQGAATAQGGMPGPWAGELPADAIRGGEQLHMDPAFVAGVQDGLELLYRRRYEGARAHFAQLEEHFPGTAIRSVADVLVWQALMMENLDFRFDKQYWTASKAARRDLDVALSTPGNEGWDHLLMASILGIESIHTMRQGGYMGALQLAFQAMDHIEKCRAAAPTYVDLKLADGLYNYWRSYLTMHNKMLPDFGDHRVQGIEQMQYVEETGIFVKPMATLSLVFSWMEEGELDKAKAGTEKIGRSYPDSVINNLVGGMVLVAMRHYDEAIVVLDKIVATDPKNVRVHYWKGLALLKSGELDAAKAEFQGYLAADHLETEQRSYGHYRLGQVFARQHLYTEAMEQYRAAVKLDGHKGAKAAIDGLESRKKEGEISF
jgi:predicted negative regulator of RcsB-dependent stress response